MKSVFFSLLSLILGAIIAYISYSSLHVVEIQKNNADSLFVQQDSAYLNEGVATGTLSQNKILSIGDADNIVFPAAFPAPILKDGNITLLKGIYLIGLSDPFHEYTVQNEYFSIQHVANGTYIVDTTGTELRIYSLTGLLRVSLLDGKKVRTKVDVFPSEFFAFDPGLGNNYDGVDVFRMGQLARLELLNYRNKEDATKFGDSSDQIVRLISEYNMFVRKRTVLATEFVRGLSAKEDSGLVLLEKYGSFFINDTKRKVILQNSLIWLAQTMLQHDTGLCSESCLKTDRQINDHIRLISERINSLNDLDPVAGEESKQVLRRYISMAAMISADRDTEYYTKGGSILVSVYQKVYQKNSIKGAYRLLSELYSQYYFPKNSETALSDLQSRLEKGLKDYVVYLVTTKSMKDEEFIGFVYFLKEFLSGNKAINGATVELFSQVISISGSYVKTIENPQMRFQGLSVVYYTISNIGNKLYENIISTYFLDKEGKSYLKPEYLAGGVPNLPTGFIAGIESSIKSFESLNTAYGEFFTESLNSGGSSIIDSKALSEVAFEQLKQLQAVTADYQAYLLKSSLKEGGGGTLAAKNKETHTLESVKSYFSQFKGLDLSTFVLKNDPKVDGFYQIVVTIDGRRFHFAFLPDLKIIRGVVFIDVDNTFNSVYRSQTINLEQKMKTWALAGRNITNKTEAKKYDFSLFFENTFFPSTESPIENTTAKPVILTQEEMSPEIKRFIDTELIKKDFTYVVDVMPIGISNVSAKVEDGEYVINIRNARMGVSTLRTSFNLVISSQYLYNSTTNAFKDIRANVSIVNGPKDPIFEGNEIQILPETISVNSFVEKTKNLGNLVAFAYSKYSPGAKKIVIDLDSNKIEIDNESYVLPNN